MRSTSCAERLRFCKEIAIRSPNMPSSVVLHVSSVQNSLTVESGIDIFDFHRRLGLDSEDVYTTCDGKLVAQGDLIQDGKTYHVSLRVLGGKGGFGSMLRAIGAQIEKTTSREACRDLSGRRMRDVNNEKQLKEWIAKQTEREKEKEQKRQEKLARRRAQPQHKFEDPDYHDQRSKVANDLQDALQTGLQKLQSTGEEPGTSGILGKRKADSAQAGPSKKKCEWLGIDVDSLSSEDSDLEEEAACHRNSEAPATVTSSEDSHSPGGPGEEDSPSAGSSGEESSSASAAAPPSTSHDQGEEEEAAVPTGEAVKAPGDEAERSAAGEEEGSASSSECTAEAAPSGSSSKQHSLLAALPPPVSSQQSKQQAETSGPVDLEQFSSAAELEALGLDRLKAALMERGVKCGGTLQERAKRLFAVKGLPLDKIDSVLLAKPSKGKKK